MGLSTSSEMAGTQAKVPTCSGFRCGWGWGRAKVRHPGRGLGDSNLKSVPEGGASRLGAQFRDGGRLQLSANNKKCESNCSLQGQTQIRKMCICNGLFLYKETTNKVQQMIHTVYLKGPGVTVWEGPRMYGQQVSLANRFI